MNELERIPEKPEKKDRLATFQKNYNQKSKTVAHILGTNMALFICILLPIFLIGFIWTDFSVQEIGVRFVADGIVTVVLLVTGEILMMQVGADGGRLDPDYISAKKVFAEILDKVHAVGTLFMAIFCEWQIDVELSNATMARLRQLRFSREELEALKDMPHSEIKAKYGRKKAKKIIELIQLEPIELNEFVLLYADPHDGLMRGGVPLSGEAYLQKKARSLEMILSCLFAGLLTISVAMTLTSDISFARVMYTIFKLIVLASRMAHGYSVGAKAYNTIEVRQLEVKSDYLRNYLIFVNDKIYLKLGDKYGDIDCLINDEDLATATTNEE